MRERAHLRVVESFSDVAEAAYDKAMRAYRVAVDRPSIANMAAAVDAWREFERLFLGKAIT